MATSGGLGENVAHTGGLPCPGVAHRLPACLPGLRPLLMRCSHNPGQPCASFTRCPAPTPALPCPSPGHPPTLHHQPPHNPTTNPPNPPLPCSGLPWWTGIIWVAVMLLWVGLVTIPTFSLVVHPRRLKRAPHVALGHDPSGSLHAGHEAHPHNISMLLDAAMSNGTRSSGAAPKAGGPHVQGSHRAAAGNDAPALAGTGGSGGSRSQQDTLGLEEDLLAEISRLRARVAQLEASQSSWAANGQGAATEAATLPAAGSRDASKSDQP